MKNKKKNLLGLRNALIFTVIFIFLFITVSNVLLPKVKDDATGKPVNMIRSCNAIEKNTVDVVILGNSNAYRGINPMKIWIDCGITSCLIGHSFISEPEAYYRAKRFLVNQSPKLLVLETDCLFDTANRFDEAGNLIYDEEETKETGLGIGAVKNKLDEAEQGILAALDSKYPTVKFNYRWKQITPRELLNVTNKQAFTSRGFLTSKSVCPFKYGNTYIDKTDKNKETIGNLNLKYFYKIIDLCKENDIKLALVTVPSGYSWNMRKHNTVKELAEQNNLSYIDFNVRRDLIPTFDWTKDTKDEGLHLNNTGASKVTAAYEKLLKKKYGLKPSELTDEQIEVWNKDTEIFCENNFNSPKEKTRKILEKNQSKFYKKGYEKH